MNRTVLVTGSSRGIGRAIAIQLAKDGFDIVIHCKTQIEAAKNLQEKIIELGRNARILQFDVADIKQSQNIIEEDIKQNSAYYGVVLNAGIAKDNAFPALEADDWSSVIHCNLDSFFNVLQPTIMPMIRARQGGRIVCMSSVSGIIGNRGQTNYAASKAGIIAAAKSLAVELAKRNITVNCVAPGFIETDMTNDLMPNKDMILKAIPMQRAGLAEEVADLVAFLISDKAAYITRQVISINGGLC